MKIKDLQDKIKNHKEGYVAHWTYTENGRPIMITARYDHLNGKSFCPFSLQNGEWEVGLPPSPHPLFGLNSLPYSSPFNAILIGEGEKVISVLHQLKWPAVTTVMGAKNSHHSDFIPLRHFHQFIILIDNDEVGCAFARSVATEITRVQPNAQLFVCNLMPSIKGADLIDWLQSHTLYGVAWDGIAPIPENSLEAVSRGLQAAIEEKMVLAAECPRVAFTSDLALFEGDPLPLKSKLLPVPDFPTDLLPDFVAQYLTACAEQFSTPVDFLASTFLTFISGIIGRNVQLEMRPGHHWKEAANVWTMLIGQPSSKKSPTARRIIKHIRHLESGACEAYKVLKNKHKQEVKLAQEQKTEEPEPPLLKRYLTNDFTTSKLKELLAGNPRGLIVFSDELKGQLQKLDKTGNEGDRSFMMQCWSGLDIYNEDRTLRGSTLQIPLTITWIGCIPPDPLANYLQQAISEGAGADGFMQRFQMITFPDFDQPYQISITKITDDQEGRIQDLFAQIDQRTESNPRILTFEDEAQKCFDEWHVELENICRSQEHPTYWESHLGKLPKLLASLTIILHTIHEVLTYQPIDKVNLATLKAAIKLLEYYTAHAKRCYESSENAENTCARKILSLIKKGKLKNRFKSSEIYRDALGGLRESQQVTAGLNLLKELDYLAMEKITGGKGRNETMWIIHPKILSGEFKF